MLKKHSQLFEGLFTASDLVVVSLAWVVAYWVRFEWQIIPAEKGIPPFGDYVRMLLFVWLVWAYLFRRMGLYRPMRGKSRLHELWLVVKANLYSVVVLLAVTYLFREKSVPFSRLVFVYFWGLATIFTLVSRTFIREMLRVLRRRGYNQRYVLIVGAGELASQVALRILRHPEYGVELLGCLAGEAHTLMHSAVNDQSSYLASRSGALNGHSYRGGNMGAREVSVAALGVPILGTYADLPNILENHGIDQVIIALPLSDHDKIASTISALGDSMVDVKIVPDFHQFVQLGREVEEFDGLPVMSIASTPLSGINRVLKRMFDLVFGATFLVLALPLLIVIAVLVKCTSRGPVFFVQERVGLDGRTFPIIKFRTMYIDAERDGARFAVKGDPRVTLIGKVLRKLNIDELPQLINVVRGHMSLVGPRPERPVFIKEFRRHFPRYMLRHKVQAGITGWAQVHGWRGNTSIEKRIEYDLFYIENWSLALDLKIIGLTLMNSFRDRNAY